MNHDELARHVAAIIARLYTAQQLAQLACRLMDMRALQEWADELQHDKDASPPSGAFGVAKRG